MSQQPTKVVVFGAQGRMGQEVLKVLKRKAWEVLPVGRSQNIKDINGADIIIDFSLPDAFSEVWSWSQANKVPLVSGTTGLNEAQKNLFLEKLQAPVLWSSNMSLGVALMKRLVGQLQLLGENFDFVLEEFHHKHKKDKPSGTAISLQEELLKHIPQKQVGDPVSIRGGGIFGVHKLWSMSESETLCIEHTALNREVFAQGAVRAAEWITGQSPGFYSLEDMLDEIWTKNIES